MTINGDQIKSSLKRVCEALNIAAPELNGLDGRLGDGDLGATLEKCAANVAALLPSQSDEISSIFKSSSLACANASGSSFGTLLAQALLVAAKGSLGKPALSRADIVEILKNTLTALSARGGATLGDKTVLDSLHAVAEQLSIQKDSESLKAGAELAARATLETYKNKRNKIGRARMFAEKSIGMDDPGMVAFLRIVEAL